MLRRITIRREEPMPATDAAVLTAEEMLSLYATRALSPVEVLQAVTERISRLNPGLNAFAVLNPRALEASDVDGVSVVPPAAVTPGSAAG